MSQRDFMRDRIWRWLRRNPDTQVSAIAAAVGTTLHSTSTALSKMKASGHTILIGSGRGSRWQAKGNRPPQDMRGTSQGSLESLLQRHNPKHWHETLPKANIANGRPQSNIILSTTIERQNMGGLRRDTAPERNVSIPSLADLCGALMRE